MAALFAHTLAGELTARLRAWIADHFQFLSIPQYTECPSLETSNLKSS